MQVFQKITRPVGRLGSGVWVSVRFQIFALTDRRGNVLGGDGNCPGGGNVQGGISYTHNSYER